MAFPIDPGDVIGHGCWETIKRVFAPVSSLWVGCFSALASLGLTEVVALVLDGRAGEVGDVFLAMAWAILYAPVVLLFTPWALLLVPLMGLGFYLNLASERDTTWLWVGSTLVTGLAVMNIGFLEMITGDMFWLAWVVFFLICASIVAGALFWRGHQGNVHARHMMEVFAENEQRRSVIEDQYGTKSFGQEGALREHEEKYPDSGEG